MRFILLFHLFFNQNLHSQNQFERDNEVTITGIVITENNNPLEYATVTIRDPKNNEIITGGLTDKNGQFSISAASGVYNLNIDFPCNLWMLFWASNCIYDFERHFYFFSCLNGFYGNFF